MDHDIPCPQLNRTCFGVKAISTLDSETASAINASSSGSGSAKDEMAAETMVSEDSHEESSSQPYPRMDHDIPCPQLNGTCFGANAISTLDSETASAMNTSSSASGSAKDEMAAETMVSDDSHDKSKVEAPLEHEAPLELETPEVNSSISENSVARGSENDGEKDSSSFSMAVKKKKKPRKKRTKAPEGKPRYSYVALITMAITSNTNWKMTLREINKYIEEGFEYYANCPLKWRNAIRHNLTLNDCFIKLPHSEGDESKAHYWTLDPDSESMFDGGSFRRRRQRYTREKDLDEILPAVIERTKERRSPKFPPHFQSHPAHPSTSRPPFPPRRVSAPSCTVNNMPSLPSPYEPLPYNPLPHMMMPFYPPPFYPYMPYHSGMWGSCPAMNTAVCLDYPQAVKRESPDAE